MSFAIIKARIADAGPNERRRADRVDVDIEARMRPLGDEGSEARIVNISATGFMAEVGGVYEVGSRVWLMLPGRERANAVVRWIAGNKIGGEFAEPIVMDALDI